jgi:hypothetical protein
MANNAYCAISLTGGGTGALDSLDGASLADGDVCFVVDAANNNLETYTLNSTLGGVAVPPSTVSPTTNAGNKRWELVKGVYKDSLSLYDGTNIGLVQLVTNILELYSNKVSGVVRVSVIDAGGNKETAADFTGGGAARLYYDNVVKFSTTSAGGTLTGDLTVTGSVTPVAPVWIDVTVFTNSWVNYGGDTNNAGYYKDTEGWVYLRGTIKTGTVDLAAFALPLGYRSVRAHQFIVSSGSATGVGVVEVANTGVVMPKTFSNNSWVSLDNIRFHTG